MVPATDDILNRNAGPDVLGIHRTADPRLASESGALIQDWPPIAILPSCDRTDLASDCDLMSVEELCERKRAMATRRDQVVLPMGRL